MLSQDTTISQETTVTSQEVAPQVEAPQAAVTEPAVQPTFLDSLAEDLRGSKSLGNFKDVNDLAKSYLHAQQLIGKRVTDMSPEDLQALDAVRGIPSAPEEYKLPEELPAEATDWYKNVASQAKLTQDQAKVVLDSYIMLERETMEKAAIAREQAHVAAVEELKNEFGGAFDKQMAVAKRAVDTFGGAEFKQLLNESGLGDNPQLVKMFAKIGQQLLEDVTVEADKESVFGLTPDAARGLVDQKLADPSFQAAYYSNIHPGHKQAVEEVTRLLNLSANR